MSENKQFVVRVLDVAQGTGALLQVDDQPPRWASKGDLIAVSTPVPPVPPADVLLLKTQEDLERREAALGRAMTLLRRVWGESGEGTGVVCRQTGANHWSDVVRWVSDSPEAEAPKPDPGQEVDRWAAFDDYEVDELHYGLIDAESEDPSPDSNSRRRRLMDELEGETKRRTSSASKAEAKPGLGHDEGRAPIAAGWGRERSAVWACPRCEQRHAITGDAWLDCVCGARYRFVYGDEPEADAPERWSGWSDEELDKLGQMLGDGGHELADLQAERRRRHEADDGLSDDGLSDVERRAVEVLAAGEWPDHPVHGVWRAGCVVAWLKAAGIVLAWEEGE